MVESQIFCELKVKWELFEPAHLCAHLPLLSVWELFEPPHLCVHLPLPLLSVEARGHPWKLFPHHLGPRSWAQGGRLGRKHYSSGWALVLGPIFILLFSNLIYRVDMVVHTIISASWEAEAGGWSWVKGFEAGLGSNIARLSWNKKSRPQVSGLCAWNPTVHCPNVVLSTFLCCHFGLPRQIPQCAWTFAVRGVVVVVFKAKLCD